jgi:psp operon transcriptional activator
LIIHEPLISKAAPLSRPVLVVGERGTGKELIAARLHYLSPRWEAPYTKINCADLTESLLESELFGHEAGAFTGAVRRRRGRFEVADGGTPFLDEIASAAVQEKILRVGEYGEFERVGSSLTVSVDVRILGAANVDLPALAAIGGFRRDLLDRLSFDVITLPPLRVRGGDILLLAENFAAGMARDRGWPAFPGFGAAAAALAAYDWPGNARELKNVVERAVYAAAAPDEPIGRIVFDPFASPYRPAAAGRPEPADRGEKGTPDAPGPEPGRPFDLRARVAELEKHLLAAALEANRFNQRRTAGYAGLTYHQLRNSLRKHGLLGQSQEKS